VTLAPVARRTALLLLAAPVAFLATFFFGPLAVVLAAAPPGSAAWEWMGSDYVRGRVGGAVLQAALSVALTLLVAAPLAWFLHRRRVPWTRAQLAVHAAPFVLPVFVVVYGVQHALGPRGLSATLLGVDALAAVGPLGAVVIAHAYYNYGFAARVLHGTLERRPVALEEAARTLGAPPTSAFLRVTLPALWPAFAAVAVLVFLLTFASFGVVLFLGQGQVSTLETMLYQNLGGAFPREDRAAALGLLQLVVNVGLFAAYFGLRRRDLSVPLGAAARRAPARRRDLALAAAFLAVALVPPLAVFAGAFRVGNEWSLEAWRAVWDASHPRHLAGFDLPAVVARSLAYAAATVALALSFTLLLAYGSRAFPRRARQVLEGAAALPLGVSSLLVGLGLLLSFGAGSAFDLRESAALVVIAHALLAFPFAARLVLPALDLRDRRLDEAAATLGARPLDVVRRVHLPQLRGPLLLAAGLAAAVSLGDFGASLLLARDDTATLAVWIARMDAPFDPLRKAQATALAAILMLLAAMAYLVVERARPRGVAEA